MEIFRVFLEMRGQFFDLFRKKGDLVFRRTGVFFVSFHVGRDFFLLFVRECHSFSAKPELGWAATKVC